MAESDTKTTKHQARRQRYEIVGQRGWADFFVENVLFSMQAIRINFSFLCHTRKVGQNPTYCPMRRDKVGNSAAAVTYSNIEENRFVVALDADVEAVAWGLGAGLFVGNQRSAAIGGHKIENRVGGVGRLV
jgi:hypothetical protein